MNFWKQFAAETGGTFTEGQYWHSDKVDLLYKDWKISFDNYTYYTSSGGNSYTQVYTRVTVPFISADNFMFEIYRRNFFSSVAKIFGAQDVEIGIPGFDKAFIIKANDEFTIKSLLGDKTIRQYIETIPDINLQISNKKGIWEEDLPEKNFELAFFTEGKVKDIEMLKNICLLIQLMLDRLENIGTIEK
jgi:hypothetical protein